MALIIDWDAEIVLKFKNQERKLPVLQIYKIYT